MKIKKKKNHEMYCWMEIGYCQKDDLQFNDIDCIPYFVQCLILNYSI